MSTGRLAGKGALQAHYGALIFSRSITPRWIDLGLAADIERTVGLYTSLVRNRFDSDELVKVLRRLSRQVWEPIRPELPSGTARIIISPDAELNFVSFCTLLEPGGTFVGEHFRVGYVSSGRDLLVKEPEPDPQRQLVILANPDFGASLASAYATPQITAIPVPLLRGLNLQPLPGAEREGLWLQQDSEKLGFHKVALYLGSDATKHKLLNVCAPEVLHLATHGFVLPAVPNNPLEKLNQGPRAQRQNMKELAPMLRSGLALAGAQNTIEALAAGRLVNSDDDGIVTAEEISCLNLQGTRLVVLSACDTGLGEAYTGEGVLGLRRAFAQAGAQNLLLTLWPVEDGATSRLIMDFYSALAERHDAAEALATTQAHWLTELRTRNGVAEACRIAGPFVLNFRGRI